MIRTIPELLSFISSSITNSTGKIRKSVHGQVETDIVETMADLISKAGGVQLGSTDTTAHRGDHGVVAYNHSQTSHVNSSDIATAKSEAISTAAADATSKANDAQSAAEGYSDATKQPIFLSLPGGAANAYVGELADMVCGENIYEGELCTPATNGSMYKSNASGVNMPATYIATQNGVMGGVIAFLKRGKVRKSGLGLSIGGTVYVSLSATPTTTPPTGGQTIQPIGRSLSATTFDFEPGLWSNDEKILNLYERSDPAATTGYTKVFNAIGSVLKSINPNGIKHWLNAVLEHTPTRGDILVYNGTSGYINQPTEQDDTFITASEMNVAADGALATIIPAGYEISSIYVEETNNAAAGDVAIGSTALGVDVVAATTIGAMHDGKLTVAKPYFSKANNTPIYVSSSAWGTASVNIYFLFAKTR